jgi:hypothetical protein
LRVQRGASVGLPTSTVNSFGTSFESFGWVERAQIRTPPQLITCAAKQLPISFNPLRNHKITIEDPGSESFAP